MFLVLVTLWSVCHVSRSQDVTERVTGGSDYYGDGEGARDSDYYDNGYDNNYDNSYDVSYDSPLLAPVTADEGGPVDAVPNPYNVPLPAPDTGSVSEPYDIPILSDNVIRTEPEDQQETLPLVSEAGVRAQGEVGEGDMCRLDGAGAESILMEIQESRGEDHSQLTTPRQLPVMGQVSVTPVCHKS